MNLSASQLIEEIVEHLGAAGVDNAVAEARWIVESSSGLTWAELSERDTQLDLIRDRALVLAARRASGEPLQYVTGSVGFRRIELAVGPGVFIPRPETEVVVEVASRRLPAAGTAVDIGTGSGPIALSLADERPDARLFATEKSSDAVAWCRKNVATLGFELELLEGDLFDPLPHSLRGKVDLVVSNPPYVAEQEVHLLAAEILDYEPHEALFADDEGLSMIRRIADEARDWLRPGGWIVMEIGAGQGPAVLRMLGELGYSEVSVHPDLAGRDRIAEGQWAAS